MTTWRHRAVLAASAVLALSGAFWAGRATRPETVKTDERVVYRDRVVEKVVEVKVRDEAATKTVERVRVVHVDGSSVERVTKRTESAAREATGRQGESQEAVAIDKIVRSSREVSGGTEWYVGILVVVAPTSFRLNDPAASLSAGVTVGRRLIGPVSVGLTATVPTTAPISVPAFGLSLTMGF